MHALIALLILAFLVLISPVHAQQVCCNVGPGLLPTPDGRALLGPFTPNAYGPNLHSDGTGRPFFFDAGQGFPDPTLQVKPNAYGFGLGMDQYGRPAVPADPGTGQSFGFGNPAPAAPQSGGFWMTVPDGRLFNPETGEWRQGE